MIFWHLPIPEIFQRCMGELQARLPADSLESFSFAFSLEAISSCYSDLIRNNSYLGISLYSPATVVKAFLFPNPPSNFIRSQNDMESTVFRPHHFVNFQHPRSRALRRKRLSSKLFADPQSATDLLLGLAGPWAQKRIPIFGGKVLLQGCPIDGGFRIHWSFLFF